MQYGICLLNGACLPSSYGWPLAILITLLAFGIGGGLFLWLITGKEIGGRYLLKKTLKTFFVWITPPWERAIKFAVVLALIIAGLALIGAATRFTAHQELTGYRSILHENCGIYPVIGQDIIQGREYLRYMLCRYSLSEYPVYTTIIDQWYEPSRSMIGLALIISGLLVATYFMTRECNKAFETK